MNFVFISLFLSISLTAPSYANVKGLEQVDLDQWTSGFFKEKPNRTLIEKLNVKALTQKILTSIKKTKNAQEAYQVIESLKINFPQKNYNQNIKIAKSLLIARNAIRPKANLYGNLNIPSEALKSKMLLLQTLAEEALYAGVVQAKKENPNKIFPIFNIEFQPSPQVDPEETFTLNGIELLQGDVLLSKGSALSSSFLARVTLNPGNYSHSTFAFIQTTEDKNMLLLPEAEMEDGVKLRSPNLNYIKYRKAKFSVYRIQPTYLDYAFIGAENYSNDLQNRKTNPPYHYDFSFDAENEETQFCSETVYHAYRKANLPHPELNPYTKKIWSNVVHSSENPNETLDDLFHKILDVKNTQFPAPSDIEWNSNFTWVAMQIDPNALYQDRIMVAMMDLFLDLVSKPSPLFAQLTQYSEHLSSKPITPDDLLRLKKNGFISEEIYNKLKNSIPDGASIKQILFFGVMNEVIGNPSKADSIYTKVNIAQEEIIKTTGSPLGLNGLRNLIASIASDSVKNAFQSQWILELKKISELLK